MQKEKTRKLTIIQQLRSFCLFAYSSKAKVGSFFFVKVRVVSHFLQILHYIVNDALVKRFDLNVILLESLRGRHLKLVIRM
jgi:hypothetical protein